MTFVRRAVLLLTDPRRAFRLAGAEARTTEVTAVRFWRTRVAMANGVAWGAS